LSTFETASLGVKTKGFKVLVNKETDRTLLAFMHQSAVVDCLLLTQSPVNTSTTSHLYSTRHILTLSNIVGRHGGAT